jgi:hypothetical protein
VETRPDEAALGGVKNARLTLSRWVWLPVRGGLLICHEAQSPE